MKKQSAILSLSILTVVVIGGLISNSRNKPFKEPSPHPTSVPTEVVEYSIAIGSNADASGSYQFCLGTDACAGNKTPCLIDIKAPLRLTLTKDEDIQALTEGISFLRKIVEKQDEKCGYEEARWAGLDLFEQRVDLMLAGGKP